MTMTCPHRPISNGWVARWEIEDCRDNPPTTWCGYCKSYVEVDEDWVRKYFSRPGRGHRTEERDRLLAQVRVARSPTP